MPADLGWVLVAIAIVAAPSVRARLLVIAPVAVVASIIVPEMLGNPGTWDPYSAIWAGDRWTRPSSRGTRPRALVAGDSLLTLVYWLLPVGFLPVLRPRWVLTLVVAGLPVLLSRWGGTHLPWFHYGARSCRWRSVARSPGSAADGSHAPGGCAPRRRGTSWAPS